MHCRRTHLTDSFACLLLMSIALCGCNSTERQARQAYGEYQAAIAANDLPAARNALLLLVFTSEDVPEYWVELGKTNVALGELVDAYEAFLRAHELNRSDPAILQSITRLALLIGNTELAENHAKELELVAPDSPEVKLAYGHVALHRNRPEEAMIYADQLLAAEPYDPDATILKARTLLFLERDQEALELLRAQIRLQPTDRGSIRALASIYERKDDWRSVVDLRRRLMQMAPADKGAALRFIEAAFRAGDVASARSASLAMLTADAPAKLIESVLQLWSDEWPAQQRVDDARRHAGAATRPDQRLAYAAFFNRVGLPHDARALATPVARLPIEADNADANAVLGTALMNLGQAGEARRRFDAVLAFDSGHVAALRGRAELALRTGRPQAALVDAQKLVTLLPESGPDRMLLYRSYSASGDPRQAERSLWQAFQDIPADRRVYDALRKIALRSGGSESVERVDLEYAHQRDTKLSRGFI